MTRFGSDFPCIWGISVLFWFSRSVEFLAKASVFSGGFCFLGTSAPNHSKIFCAACAGEHPSIEITNPRGLPNRCPSLNAAHFVFQHFHSPFTKFTDKESSLFGGWTGRGHRRLLNWTTPERN